MSTTTILLDDGERRVVALHLQRPFSFVTPFPDEEFALLLSVADDDVTGDERSALSDAVVRAGCRYACCHGHDCSSWDDAVDWAYLATDPDYDPPDARFVMTTWHEDESVADVAEFLVWCTSFDDFEPTRFLVILLGGDARAFRRLCAAVNNAFR